MPVPQENLNFLGTQKHWFWHSGRKFLVTPPLNPLKPTIFSFDSPSLEPFSHAPATQIPPAPLPYLMKSEGPLSETKKVTRYRNKFKTILVSNTCFCARVSLSIYEWSRYPGCSMKMKKKKNAVNNYALLSVHIF